MSAESLSATAGIVLSLILSYVPGLSTLYNGLESAWKRLILLVLLALVAAGVMGIACAGWGAAWGIAVTCDQAGLQALLSAFVLALIGSQAAYAITPKRAAKS